MTFLARFRFWFLIIGFGLGAAGWDEQRLSSLAKPEPTSISLLELSQKGPGDNAHLIINDYFLCTWDYIYAEKNGKWTECWIPAVPLDGPFHRMFSEQLLEDGTWPEDVPIPVPDQLNVVFKLSGSPTESSMDRIAAADTSQGLIVNEIDALDEEEQRLLQESYPKVDFSSAYIFEPGREPTSATKVYLMLGGGVALILAGLAMFFGGRRQSAPQEDDEDGSSTTDKE